ncbi:MAG TPA: electron transfer flavoprotein subunit alpha/FixB family protein [Candidatus Onthomorpha intestinigallinarum]|uniref:Electron transfer flavoprotein subunit alpha/FixB family protein n=1 Tax=Candidatus Onthomorpha intestinigallinarum TaxID=2840880 RepID=A0A9D1UI04_9BACT|nr:electron transfer flavoprotein subunit alpha/FixB family protein [Candidatus Onthomorpha intestinigallinarum]
MNNIFVYCEITEERTVADVSLELLSKARKLAEELKCQLEAIVISDKVEGLEQTLYPYGVDIINYAQDSRLFPYQTLPHFSIVTGLLKEKDAQICLFGATSIGRDLAPRVASFLRCGLTADCTSLEIGSHQDKKENKTYENLLYQIRPAFGGNIIATIINPETRPQMATVREGVMKKEIYDASHKGCVNMLDIEKYVSESDFCIKVISREIEAQKINIKNSQIVVVGGYGMASGKDGFGLIHELAKVLGGEVGATRAAVDAGLAEHERQVGQTGVTIRPKLCISCGVSGAVQHRAGMDQSSKIISINTDPKAPINAIADYTIIGDAFEIIPKLIKHYKANTK